jgi:hypothetical protein
MGVIGHQAPGPDQEPILIGSFAQEVELDGTVGIAVEDGHPAIASLRHIVRACRRLLHERFWPFELTLALPLTESQNCI